MDIGQPDAIRSSREGLDVTGSLLTPVPASDLKTMLAQVRECIAQHQHAKASELLDKADVLSPGNAAIGGLRTVIQKLAQSDDRRRAFDDWSAKIRSAFDRDDYPIALSSANEALQQFPGNAEFLNLKILAEKQCAAVQTRAQAAMEIAACRNALIAGKPNEALAQIEDALRRFSDEPALNWLLAAAKDSLSRQKQDVLRTDLLRTAREHIARADFEKAIETLERARAEIGGKDIEALLQFAQQEQSAAERRARIDRIREEADKLVSGGQLQEAVRLVSDQLSERPDDELKTIFDSLTETEAQRKSAILEVLSTVRRLLREARFQKCADFLSSQPLTIREDPEVKRILPTVERERERWQTITDAKQHTREAISGGKFADAEALLMACERQCGGSLELKLLRGELESTWAAAANRNVEKALADTRMLLMDHLFADALRALDGVSEDLRHASDDLKKQYDEQRKACQGGLAEEERIRLERLKAIAAAGGETVVISPSEAEAKLRKQTSAIPGQTVIVSSPQVQQRIALAKAARKARASTPFWQSPVVYMSVLFTAAIAGVAWYAWAPVQLTVDTSPGGAAVRVDGKICIGPHCSFRVRPGQHVVDATSSGYEPASRAVSVASADRRKGQTVQIALVPMAPLLQISSNFVAGQLALDGARIGTFQNGQYLLPSLTIGPHTLAISSDYGQVELALDVPPGRPPIIARFIKAPDVRVVAISTSPDGVSLNCNCKLDSVIVDDRPLGTPVSSSKEIGRLPAGVHLLKASEAGEQSQMSFEVRSQPAATLIITSKRNVGTLAIVTGVRNSDIFVDGKRYPSGSTGVVELPVEPRVYAVRVSKRGYEPAPEQRVEVRKNQETRLVFKLQRKPSILTVTEAPPGTQIRIDNVVAGTVRQDGIGIFSVLPGKHTIAFEKDGYQPANQVTQVTPGANLRVTAPPMKPVTNAPAKRPAKPGPHSFSRPISLQGQPDARS